MPLEQLTVVPEHSEPEPTPTTEMGLQVRPRRTLRSLRLMPRRLRRAAPAAEFAYNQTKVNGQCRLVTRCRILTGSVLAQQAVVAPPEGAPPRATAAGVATARRGRARRVKDARRENILVMV